MPYPPYVSLDVAVTGAETEGTGAESVDRPFQEKYIPAAATSAMTMIKAQTAADPLEASFLYVFIMIMPSF